MENSLLLSALTAELPAQIQEGLDAPTGTRAFANAALSSCDRSAAALGQSPVLSPLAF